MDDPGFRSATRLAVWSRTDPAVHYAFYEFADLAEAQVATGSEKIAPLVADSIASGQPGAAAARDLEIVREMGPSAP